MKNSKLKVFLSKLFDIVENKDFQNGEPKAGLYKNAQSVYYLLFNKKKQQKNYQEFIFANIQT